jgi:DNA-binding NtrC family response regulator
MTSNFTKKRVLLFEKDVDDCQFFSQALVKVSERFTLFLLDDVDQLMALIERYKPCLIFINFHLLEFSDPKYLKRIQENECYKKIPIYIWSTSHAQRNVTIAEQKWAKGIIQKQNSIQELQTKLKNVFQQLGLG